jgi:hypothetical protein
MKRFRDEVGSSDQLTARAAELVGAAPAITLSDLRLRRLKSELLAPERPRRRAWVLRPAVVIGALLAMVAIGSAMIGRKLVAPSIPPQLLSDEPIQHRAPASPRPLPIRVVVPPVRERVVTVTPASEDTTPSTPASVDDAPPATEVVAPQTSVPAPTDEAPRAPAAARPPSSEEASVLLRATHALRRAHDVTTCEALLAEHERRYPDGGLREEALALAIEAAEAKDVARAARLARRYLETYPRGRFRATADDAIARSRAVPEDRQGEK